MATPTPDPPWLVRLRLSAAQGQAEAQYELALLYLRGQGLPCDPDQARRWLRMAAQQGHAAAVSLMTGIPQGHVVSGPSTGPGA